MRKASTRWLALFLAVLLSFSLLVMPAAADEVEENTAQTEETDEGVVQTAETVDVPTVNVIETPSDETADTAPAEETAEEEQTPAETPAQPEETAPSDETAVTEDTASEEPEQDGAGEHTVSYFDGATQLGMETVADGESPQNAPKTILDGTAVAGWTNAEGTVVTLADLTVTSDMSLYAWTMPVLDTTNHKVYINGMTTTTFEPDGSLTRAQAAKLLYGLLVSTNQGPVSYSFSDVALSQWYGPAVTTLASYGILSGYSDGTFLPNNSITRAEFVTIIVRITGASGGTATFSDTATHWASASISTAASNGWVNGYTDGTFQPNKGITRAEAVTVLNRVLGRTPDTTAIAQDSDNAKFTDVSSHWAYYQIMEAALEHTYTKASGSEVWLEYSQNNISGSGITKIDNVTYYVKDGKKTYLNAGLNKVDDVFLYAASAGYAVTGVISGNTVTFTDGTTAAQTLKDGFNLIGSSLCYWNAASSSATYLTAGLNTIAGKTYYANTDGYTIRNDFGAGPVELNGNLYLSDGYCAIITSGQVYKSATSALTTADLAGRLYEYTVYNSSGTLTSSAMYYVNSDYTLLRNAWYTHLYFGSDGKYTTTDSTLDAYVDNVILNYVGVDNNVTTQYQKLLKAYYYMRGGSGNTYSTSQFGYRNLQHGYETGLRNGQVMYDWQISAAKTMFSAKRGMCYEWACAYLYLARRLGFNAYSVVGHVFASRARHCWNMIYWGGAWHISDVELEWGYICGYYSGGISEYWDLSSQAVTSTGDGYVYTNPQCTTVKYYFSTGL